MDIAITFVLTSIYKLAEQAGLLNYLKQLPAKSAEAFWEKLVQDKFVEKTFLNKLFTPKLNLIFEHAFETIAPQRHEVLKRAFLLAVLTDPEINRVFDNMRLGELPSRQLLIPVFQRLFPQNAQSVTLSFVGRFIEKLYSELSKEQQYVNLALLMLYEKEAMRFRLLIEKLEELKSSLGDKKTSAFFVPAFPANFIARKIELQELRRQLIQQPAIVPIYGMPGVGKSYLATRFAHESDVSECFQGVYWQFCGSAPVTAIAVELATKIGLSLENFSLDKVQAEIKSYLSQRRCLLILDDVQDKSIGQLLPGGRTSVIITSQHRDLSFLSKHDPIDLDIFSEEESFELLRNKLGEKLGGHEVEVYKIINAVGRLPIAIAVVASLLRDDVRMTFPRFLELLVAPYDGSAAKIDILSHRADNVSRLFTAAIESLAPVDEQLFCAMAACASEGFHFTTAFKISGLIDEQIAHEGLQHLVDRSLVRELNREAGRYFMHALVRQAAHTRPAFVVFPEIHAKLMNSLLPNWTKLEDIDLRVLSQNQPEFEEAIRWMFLNKADFRGEFFLNYMTYKMKRDSDLNRKVLEFYDQLKTLLDEFEKKQSTLKRRKKKTLIPPDWEHLNKVMSSLDKNEPLFYDLKREEDLASIYNTVGTVLKACGRFEDALTLYKKKEALCLKLGNKVLLQESYLDQALLLHGEDFDLIMKKYDALTQELEKKYDQEKEYLSRFAALIKEKKWEEALEFSKKIERLYDELGDKKRMPLLYYAQTEALVSLKKWDEAMTSSQQGEILAEKLGDDLLLAKFRLYLAVILWHKKQADEAKEKAEDALQIFTELNRPSEIADTKKLLDLIDIFQNF